MSGGGILEESSATKCVVQIHFAGNYTCVFQDEVQSAHWNHKPLTVFTTCVWKGAKHITSYAVVADTTIHDNKSTALIALEVLLAAEIEGSTQRHNPRATMLHLSPCLQFR